MGLGVRQSSDVISLRQETCMFEKGILGEGNPEQSLITVVYMVGMHCALCGGLEHNKLCRLGCDSQFSFEFDGRGIETLVYQEDPLQKTNQGGLICKGKSKVVYVNGSEDKSQCPIRIIKQESPPA